MSAESETRTAPRHLTKHKYDLPGSPGNPRDNLTSREFYCCECRATVTRGVERDGEYGHCRDCQHSIRGGGE